MVTRRQRMAQAEAMGQSEPHTSLPPTARRQTHAPKGQGTPLAAAVGSIAGSSEVNHTTALLHQVVPYDNRVDQRPQQVGILSDNVMVQLQLHDLLVLY